MYKRLYIKKLLTAGPGSPGGPIVPGSPRSPLNKTNHKSCRQTTLYTSSHLCVCIYTCIEVIWAICLNFHDRIYLHLDHHDHLPQEILVVQENPVIKKV